MDTTKNLKTTANSIDKLPAIVEHSPLYTFPVYTETTKESEAGTHNFKG